MLKIPFNANDLRLVVYSLFTLFIVWYGLKISKRFKVKAERNIYIISIFIINVLIIYIINKIFMWM